MGRVILLRTGAIYTISYARWKTNYTVYAFILWPGGALTKTHLLNLGAKQLNIVERTRIVRLIVKLSKIPTSNNYDGRLLYKIFKTYLKKEISKCYRTYFTQFINSAALINYGLNEESDFTKLELDGQNKVLYERAQRDYQVKAINWYSDRGYDMEAVKASMAGETGTGEIDKADVDETTTSKPNIIKPATKPATRAALRSEKIKDDQNIDDNNDDDDFGY